MATVADEIRRTVYTYFFVSGKTELSEVGVVRDAYFRQ